jgi:hypothetical protein
MGTMISCSMEKTASGSPTGGIVYNSYVRSTTNYFDSWNFSLENSSIEVNKFKNTRLLMV